MPGLRQTATSRAGDQRWIGSRHALNNARTATINPALFTKAQHYPSGYLPSGLPVNAANSGNVGPFTGAAGQVLRFLKDNHEVKADVDEIQVALLWHGLILTDFLPVPFTIPTGYSGGFAFEGGNG